MAVLLGDLTGEKSAIAPVLLGRLSARYNLPLSYTALRQWASEGVRLPKPDGSGNETVKLGRLGTDRYSRGLYSVADAARIGAGLYVNARIGVSA